VNKQSCGVEEEYNEVDFFEVLSQLFCLYFRSNVYRTS
jgi:hypothetical protein